MSGEGNRSVLLASFDEAFAERATTSLYPHHQVIRCEPEPEPLMRAIETTRPDVCLIDIEESNWDGTPHIDLVASVRSVSETMPIVIATYDISVATVVPAMRAGANDVTDKDFAADALLAQIDWLVQSRPTRRGEESGRLITVLGLRGGLGATTVAVGLALEMAYREDEAGDILLLDFSHPPPEIPEMLGLTANYSVKDAVSDVSRLDATMIDNAFTRVKPHRLFVLPLALDTGDADAVGAGDALNLLTVLRTYFRTIVIDANPVWRPAFAERVFLDAHDALLCCGQSISALHATSVFLDGLRERNGVEPAFRLVVPRHDPALHPSADELKEALGAPNAPLLVADDRRRIETLRNSGQPLIDPRARTPFAKSIRLIADEVTGREPAAGGPRTAARGLWDRLGLRRRPAPTVEAAE